MQLESVNDKKVSNIDLSECVQNLILILYDK